jgi:putative ATP-binding cassette transporter
LERIGTAEIYDRITENMTLISQSAGMLANFLRSLFIVAFGTLYMIYLSFTAFVLVFFLLSIAVTMYFRNDKEIVGHLQDGAQKRVTFFNTLTDLLDGFKEIKFSQRRSDALQEDIVQSADAVRSSMLKANLLLDGNTVIPPVNMCVLLIAVAFVLPQHVPMQAETVAALLALVMFIFYPISGVIMGYPAYMRANLALDNIDALEKKLDQKAPPAGASVDPWRGRLAAIEANRIGFRYEGTSGDEAFYIGPLSLTVTSGEVLFIIGGNGSGKSTLLKVLTGIYPPSEGALSIDGIPVRPANVQAYREMISTVYADFHLFHKVYGLASVEDESVRRLLKLMQLDKKTSFANQRFSTTNLSTGQRKRLALAVALLEDRPVYAFDELAADQDPEFRTYFYKELIPELKRRGKTVIVVTHDDRYFHCADRVATMEYGQLRSIVAKIDAPAEITATGPGEPE